MSSEMSDSTELAEMPLEMIREMKRKACEKLSSLIRSISSASSPKKSKRSCLSFLTYKALIKSYKNFHCV
ncbi:hypothetical protein COOONC_12074 [Cooperia oncophora]